MSPITLSAFAILGVQSRMTSRHSWAMVWGGMLQAESPANHHQGCVEQSYKWWCGNPCHRRRLHALAACVVQVS